MTGLTELISNNILQLVGVAAVVAIFIVGFKESSKKHGDKGSASKSSNSSEETK